MRNFIEKESLGHLKNKINRNPMDNLTQKVIVTGGAGFIGSHMVDFLLDRGIQVVVVDNLSSGRRENIKHNLKNPKFSFRKLDISDYSKQKKLVQIFKNSTYIFHLAALADIVSSIENPTKYFRSNVDGTINVLEAARKNKIEKFVYAASSSYYGIAKEIPTPETASIKPEYPYALTKYLGEQCVLHWGKVYNLPVVSLRFFNVYGPRTRTSGSYGAVFGVFLAQKANKKPLTIVGDGNQTRDFTFVTDIVQGIYQAATKSEVRNEIINLGSGHTYSINKLAELIGGKVVHIPQRPGEPDCTFADITKAKKLLGYRPRVSFEEGVKIMLKYLDTWKKAPVWTPKKIKKATRDWFKYLSKK